MDAGGQTWRPPSNTFQLLLCWQIAFLAPVCKSKTQINGSFRLISPVLCGEPSPTTREPSWLLIRWEQGGIAISWRFSSVSGEAL